MGILQSRETTRNSLDTASDYGSYKFPAKNGNYFGFHFIMGGERFETGHPEAYLFGDNSDLNFLGEKPVQFPYPPPHSGTVEPIKAVQSLVHVRRDSLKFVKTSAGVADQPNGIGVGGTSTLDKDVAISHPLATNRSSECFDDIGQDNKESASSYKHNIEFTFDCDCAVLITIFYFAVEEHATAQGLRYVPKRPELASKTFRYDMGANQVFSQPSHVFDPTLFTTEALCDLNGGIVPVVIHCKTDDPEEASQTHATLAIVEKSAEGSGFLLKPVKQKLNVDGVTYLVQEIYGIENKQGQSEGTLADDYDESNAECVICMSDLRDTLILPCRHLCLCANCAETLRYKASNCPICRSPFRALLQLRTCKRSLNKQLPNTSTNNTSATTSQMQNQHLDTSTVVDDQGTDLQLSAKPATHDAGGEFSLLSRYDAMPLLEALNGPQAVQRMGSMQRKPVLPVIPPKPAPLPNIPSGAGQPVRAVKSSKKSIKTVSPIQEVLTPAVLAPLSERSNISRATDLKRRDIVEGASNASHTTQISIEDSGSESDSELQMSPFVTLPQANRTANTTQIVIEDEEKMTTVTLGNCDVDVDYPMAAARRRHSASDSEDSHHSLNLEGTATRKWCSNEDVAATKPPLIAALCPLGTPVSTTDSLSSVSSTKPLIPDAKDLDD